MNAALPESVAWRARWRLFRRLIIRPLFRDRLRTALTVLSIALGVAVVVAIDLAGRAAAGSFESSVESLSGKATLTISGIGGIDEKLLGELVQLPYPLRFTRASKISPRQTAAVPRSLLPASISLAILIAHGDKTQAIYRNYKTRFLPVPPSAGARDKRCGC